MYMPCLAQQIVASVVSMAEGPTLSPSQVLGGPARVSRRPTCELGVLDPTEELIFSRRLRSLLAS